MENVTTTPAARLHEISDAAAYLAVSERSVRPYSIKQTVIYSLGQDNANGPA